MFGRKKQEPTGVVFVRPASMGGTCAVIDPATGAHVVPEPGKPYDANHPLVRAYGWLFLSAEELAAAEAHTPTSVRLDDLDRDPKELLREALAGEARRNAELAEMTPEERHNAELDVELNALGFTVVEEDGVVSIRLPAPNPHRDQRLYARPDAVWAELFGLFEGARLAQAPRGERARALAARGALNREEVEHVRYIATAAAPIDSVKPDTEPLSQADARAAVELLPAPSALDHEGRPIESFKYVNVNDAPWQLDGTPTPIVAVEQGADLVAARKVERSRAAWVAKRRQNN